MYCTNTGNIFKTIRSVLPKVESHWVGDGFLVKPVFANAAFTKEISPFLMFDYAAPRKLEADQKCKRKGVGQHPHRGMNKISIIILLLIIIILLLLLI